NILVPTNPVLIGILTMAGIPYDRWLRFVLPFLLKIWLAAVIALIVAVQINYT
ncbi:MAG: YfcC family protein, partial [Rhodothermales bacterium]|nr:YfcC family protein [Rhodothermales bacterium]